MIQIKQDERPAGDQDASQNRLAICAGREKAMPRAHHRFAGYQP
jgi:hypothetical protein